MLIIEITLKRTMDDLTIEDAMEVVTHILHAEPVDVPVVVAHDCISVVLVYVVIMEPEKRDVYVSILELDQLIGT